MAPQSGGRIVHVPGHMQLGVDALRNVSNISVSKEDSDILVVEFFDTRDAQRMQNLVAENAEEKSMPSPSVAPPPGLGLPVGLAPPPGLTAPDTACLDKKETSTMPAYVELPEKAQANVESSAMIDAPMDVRSPALDANQVLLEGLPKAICSEAYLEVILDEAGVEGTIVACHLADGASVGEAIVKFETRRSAKKCIKHFQGRRWDMAGCCQAVKATLLGEGNVEKREKKPKKKANVEAKIGSPAATLQLQEAMSMYYNSPAGQLLLHKQYGFEYGCGDAAEKPVVNINLDAFSDASDSEGTQKIPKSSSPLGRHAFSEISTADGSDVGDRETVLQEVH